MWIKLSLLGIWWVQSFSEYFRKLLWWWRLPISRYWNVKMQWYELLQWIWINQATFWKFYSLHLLSRKYPNCLESLYSFMHTFISLTWRYIWFFTFYQATIFAKVWNRLLSCTFKTFLNCLLYISKNHRVKLNICTLK